MDARVRQMVLFGATALILLIALVTPWWTATFEAGGGGETESAGPFDVGSADDDMIAPGEAMLAGLLILMAMLMAAAVAILNAMPRPPENYKFTSTIFAGVALLFTLAAVVLAPTTWPDDMGFWDTQSASFFGFEVSVTTYANAGWFFAIVAAIMLVVAVAMMAMESQEEATQSATPAMERCQAVTKSGSQCSRKPAQGRYCNTHA